jgi:hypothetical protein
MVCRFIGRITLSKTLSCDRVMDGAFFSHPDFQVPEKKMGQHARYHMVVPSWKFAHLVVIHTQLCFGFLEALLNSPSQATEPHERF